MKTVQHLSAFLHLLFLLHSSPIEEIQKGKQVAVSDGNEEEDSWYSTAKDQEIQIAEGTQDPNFGFKDMRLFTITYQQHHVKVNICIQGKIFQMIALLDSGVDINILNIKIFQPNIGFPLKEKQLALGIRSSSMKFPKLHYVLIRIVYI